MDDLVPLESVQTRYAHLLQPIRDLTKNWDIDVASQLEEYLCELEQISIGFEGSSNKMNFAEAALVIQGSACVYSRKVEYLYALVYQALDLIASNKKLAQLSSVNDQGKDTDASFAQRQDKDNQFLTLDDIKEATNIDMIETNNTPKLSKSSIVQRTPMSLVPLHGSEKLTSTPLYSQNGELLGNKLDYKLYTSMIHSNGVLLLEPIKQLMNEGHLDGGHIEAEDNEIPDITLIQPPPVDELPEETGGAMDNSIDDVGGYHGNSDHVAPFCFSPDGNNVEAAQIRPRVRLDKKAAEPRGLKKLDPHESGAKTENKPFRKGNSQRLPLKLQPSKSKTRKRKNIVSPSTPSKNLAQFLFDSFFSYSCLFPKNKFLRPSSTEFEQEYWKETKRRKSQLTKLQKRAKATFEVEEENVEDDSHEDHYEPLGNDDFNDDFQTQIDGAVLELQNARCNDDRDALGGVEPMALDSSLSEPRPGSADVVQTYEDLVRHYVSNALNIAVTHATETELTKRVREWEERIKPRLLSEEELPAFDIHQYGSTILDELKTRKDSEDVCFSDIVRGKDPHEICRMFTASLQLANDRNIDIKSSSDICEEDIDSLTLTLLSTELRHKDIAKYRVPSAQTSSNSTDIAKYRVPSAQTSSNSTYSTTRKRSTSESLEQERKRSKRS